MCFVETMNQSSGPTPRAGDISPSPSNPDSSPSAPGSQMSSQSSAGGGGGGQDEYAVTLLAQASAQNDAASTDGGRQQNRFFTSAQWTADGTSIITELSDRTVSTFVVPDDLLQETDAVRTLQPQATIALPEPTSTVTPAPFFSLLDPASQTLLVGCRDHPIQLYPAFPGDEGAAPLASYKLIKKETEEHITPSSLLWKYPGTHFVCGSADRLDYFDMSRHGSDGPVLTIPTIPSRRHISKGSGVGMRGTVSALAASQANPEHSFVLAAGTRTRWLGLYDMHRTDKIVANWSVAGAGEDAFQVALGGQGIVQLLWSPDGRYLVVNERHARGLLVYDVRGSGRLLSVLRGRPAATQQRLGCDAYQNDLLAQTGPEVWGGSADGTVCVWDGVGQREGLVDPSWGWAGHGAPVGSTVVHPSGSVAATCSGGWVHVPDAEMEDGTPFGPQQGGDRPLEETSLKIWSIVASAGA